MKKKGFTLIELLAVIVILAVIALIAVPIVLNIINNSKDSSYVRSAELYAHSLENNISSQQTINSSFNPSSCTANSDGTALCDGVTLEIVTKNTSPKSGTIKIKKGEVDEGSTLTFDDTTLTYKKNKWVKEEPLAVAPDNCFTTKLWEGDELTEFNESFDSSYTSPVVTITGYTCGNSVKGFDSNSPTMYTFNHDGKNTKISIPEELPVVNVETVTYNKTVCESLFGEGSETCASQQALLTELGITEDQLKGKGSINDIASSEYTPLFNFTTSITDTTKYPVVGIIGLMRGLEKVEMKDNIEILFQSFLYADWSEITLPSSLKYLGNVAFAFNPNLREIEIPYGTKYIYSPFEGDKLEKVSIPGSVELIWEASFENQNIKELYLGEGISGAEIDAPGFNKNKLETVTIPSSMIYLDNFFANNQLKEMIIEGKCSKSDFKSFDVGSTSWADGYSEANIVWKGTNCQ